MQVQERIQKFLASQRMTARDFEYKVGLGSGVSGRICALSRRSTFNKIAKAFPELNITWLMTGEGEMLNKNVATQQIGNGNTSIVGNNNQLPRQQPSDNVDHVAYLNTIISQKDEIIRQKDAQIDQLLQLLKTYTGK